MADRTIVGSLIVTTSVETGPFAAAMTRMSAATARASGRMRQGLGTTADAVDRVRNSAGRPFRLTGFLAASRALDNVNRRADTLKSSLLGLTAIFGGFSAALAANAVMAYADSYTELQNRLRVVTSSSVELMAVQEELLRVSNEARVGFKETVILYGRLAVAAKRLGLSQRDLIDIASTIQKAFIVGGSTPLEASQSAIQLSQGIASNRLSGDELRSVLENQALGQLLADQIAGGDIGKLRKLAEEGKLTAGVIAKAFLNAREEINKLFSQTTATIGQAFILLDNALLDYIGRADQATGASRILVGALKFVAQNIDGIAQALVFLVGALGVKFASGLAGAAAARVMALGATLRAIVPEERAARLSMAAQALAARETALAHAQVAGAALQTARAENAAAQSNLAATRSAYALARANQIVGVTTTQAGRAVMVANQQAALATANLTAAQRAYQAATVAATFQTSAHSVALARAGVVATATASALRGLSAVMAFFGGPLNFALTAAAVGFYLLATRISQADRISAAHQKTMEGLRQRILGVAHATAEERAELIKTMQVEMAKAKLSVSLLEARRTQIRSDVEQFWGWIRNDAERQRTITIRTREATADINEQITAAQARVVEMDQTWTMLQEQLAAGSGEINTAMTDAGDSTKKLANKMEELRIEAASGGLDAFNASVADTARQAGIAESKIMAFIQAVRSGSSLEGVDPTILEIRNLKQIIDAWAEYENILQEIGPTAEQVARRQEMLNFLVSQGAISAQQASASFADWLSGFERYDFINQISDAVGDLLGNLFDLSEGWDSAKDAALDFLKTMTKMITQILVVEPLIKALRGALGGMAAGGGGGGPLGGIFGRIFSGLAGGGFAGGAIGGGLAPVMMGGLYHRGGVVGPGGPQRPVPAALFADAPRLHAGGILGPRERPAILEDGETVLPRGAGVGVVVNVINKNGSDVKATTRQGPTGPELDVLIDTAVAEKMGRPGSRTSNMMRSSFGVGRQLTKR